MKESAIYYNIYIIGVNHQILLHILFTKLFQFQTWKSM